MRISWLLWLACEICCGLLSGADFYVSTTGTPAGAGTQASPWDIGTAFTAVAKIQPGDTLWLKGGRYHWEDVSRWEIRFSGTVAAPITVRSAPNELAILDTQLAPPSPDVGWFRVFGSNLIFRDLRFTCSSTRPRTTNVGGSSPWSTNPVAGQPPDPLSFRGSVSARGANILFINDIFDNLNEGLAHQQVTGGGAYGCIGYHHGWNGPDRKHGHFLYGQQSEPTKVWDENIGWGNYSHGAHFYGQNAAIDFVTSTGGVYFGNAGRDILFGGGRPSKGLNVTEHFMSPGGSAMFGYTDPTWTTANIDAQIKDCFFPFGKVTFGSWQTITQPGTRIGAETGTKVFVRPNKYEPHRSHVIAYAFEGQPNVTVDLGLPSGTKYTVKRVWQLDDPPLASGMYTGPITLPMVASTAPAPISSGEQPKQMAANFGVFLVRSTDVTLPTPTPVPTPIPVPAVKILEPADGTTLAKGQAVTFRGSGESLVWKLDVVGASNPAPMNGVSVTYTVPFGEVTPSNPNGTTRINVALTGAGGTDSRSYPVVSGPIPAPIPTPVPVPVPVPTPGWTEILSLGVDGGKLYLKFGGKLYPVGAQ